MGIAAVHTYIYNNIAKICPNTSMLYSAVLDIMEMASGYFQQSSKLKLNTGTYVQKTTFKVESFSD